MIPRDYVTRWRARAPWAIDAQVEQDLVISRALVELFRTPGVAERLAECSRRSTGNTRTQSGATKGWKVW